MSTATASERPLSGAALTARFDALTQLLIATQVWWRPAPFQYPVLPWEENAPELGAQLRGLPAEEVRQLQQTPTALASLLAPWLPEAPAAVALAELPLLAAQPLPATPEPRDVPGRKWQQIEAFLARCAASDLPALEWCSGKAHLGRRYAALGGAPVTALERDAALVAAAGELARRDRLPVQARCCDVLEPGVAQALRPDQQVLALHACGELHRTLLRLCTERRPAALLLSPCCYHLGGADRYQPLSRRGAAAGLTLSREELRTPLQETVTSPGRVARQRETLQAWRLGYDLLQRQLRGSDDYLRMPPLPAPATLAAGFPALCRRLAEHHRLVLPGSVDFARWERAGWQRLAEVEALDLLRTLFRPALELWLVLDGAALLVEQGYQVEVGRFCSRQLTPRNLLLRASTAALDGESPDIVANTYTN